jgi:hypothetical protein
MDKHQHVGIDPALPCKNGFGQKIGGNQGIHMGV